MSTNNLEKIVLVIKGMVPEIGKQLEDEITLALQQERERHEKFKSEVREILDDHMRRDDRLDSSELEKIYHRLRKLLSQPKEES